VEPYLTEIDLVLVMSVHPGWGGQAFIPECSNKVHAARDAIDGRGLPVEIEIDGECTTPPRRSPRRSGVDILVAGSAIFGEPDPAGAARALRAARGRTRRDPGRQDRHRLRRGHGRHPRRPVRRSLEEELVAAGFTVVERRVVPDGVEAVAGALGDATRGLPGSSSRPAAPGSGPATSPPRGPRQVLERDAPGLAEAMRTASNRDGRGFGMLSRGVCGSVGNALVLQPARLLERGPGVPRGESSPWCPTRWTSSPAATRTDPPPR